MPFLAVTHVHAVQCPQCGTTLAEPGSRSFIVTPDGSPIFFAQEALPAELAVELRCPNGHQPRLLIPNQAAAQDVASIPDEAPIGADALLMEL